MDVIAKQFGVEHMMPLHKARYAVMKERTIGFQECVDRNEDHLDEDQSESNGSFRPCNVMKALTDNIDPYDYDSDNDYDDDDDDCSNSSMEGETSCSSDSCGDDIDIHVIDHHRSVTFCTPLVTACYVRPTTTYEEKLELFYTDIDYREFRRNFVIYNRKQKNECIRRKSAVVQFHADVITDICTIPSIDNPSELYYSRSELQGFLDDFVSSLSKRV